MRPDDFNVSSIKTAIYDIDTVLSKHIIMILVFTKKLMQ